MTVGLLASDLPQNLITEKPADTLRLLRDYATQAEAIAAQGAKVIVIPEKIAVLLDSELPEADSLLQSTAANTGALIVVGVIHPTNSARWNEARLYFPDGFIRTYEKHHMLPVYEGKLTVGTERTEWREPSGLWGIEICKDMDFPRLSRQYGNDGVALMLVQRGTSRLMDGGTTAWPFCGELKVGSASPARQSKACSVSLIVAAASSLNDRLHLLPSPRLVATVPVEHETTLYDRFGNWFGWLNVILFVVLVATVSRTADVDGLPTSTSFMPAHFRLRKRTCPVSEPRFSCYLRPTPRSTPIPRVQHTCFIPAAA